jgi:hypothetical protein
VLAQRVLLPPGGTIIQLATLIGLGVLAFELAIVAGWLIRESVQTQAAGRSYVRVRIPRPEGDEADLQASGAELFYALHQLLAGEPRHGKGGWLSLVLSGAPDEPVTLGAVLGGASAVQRAGWAAALRKVVTGHAPGAIVDESVDPLARTLQPGASVLWQEFALAPPTPSSSSPRARATTGSSTR